MKYLSVCSGIEAATVAWHPLGWKPVAFSEIEKFPAAVLAHHYPRIPNYGNMTKFKEWPDHAIDLLVGGTPCQSFSIAGLRKGLDDPRGNLMLTYLAIAERYRPQWLAWENVPGVLSVEGGRAFAAFIGGLAKLGYHASWRVLDAQFVRVDGFGRAVPQRRRRVIVVGHFGDWRRAAAVLFERESLLWNSAPRREAGKNVAPTIAARTRSGGGLGTDAECDGALIASTGSVSHCLNAGGMGRIDYETDTLVAHAMRADGFDASEDGTGRGTPIVPIAFSSKDYGADVAPILRAMGHDGSHANAGGQAAIAFAIQAGATRQNPASGPDGVGVQEGHAYTLEARQEVQAVAFDMRGRDGGSQFEGPHDTANIRASSGGSSRSYALIGYAVRRLTPLECERLQGFPDGYTNIPWRGKNSAPDGPRYKAIGNSMAVNVMRWIGRRIAAANEL